MSETKTISLDSPEILKYAQHFFKDILEFLQGAKFEFDETQKVVFAEGWVKYNSTYPPTQNHTVGENGSIIVPGFMLDESAARLLTLAQILSGYTELPRLAEKEKIPYKYKVVPNEELYIQLTNFRRRGSLVKINYEVNTLHGKVFVTSGTLTGIGE